MLSFRFTIDKRYMNNNYYCVIMAGGVGSRFWPMSRANSPKQFNDILGLGQTFIQMTYNRFKAIVPEQNILVVTSERYFDLVHEQLPQLPEENILLEPYKRNTAPCIAYATYKLYAQNPDATVVVAPADHLITGEVEFQNTILTALDEAAVSDKLFTIGIEPTRPETNYGYIQANKKVSKEACGKLSYQVKTFTEKPDAELAKVFIDTGEFFWNSGIFIWNLKTIKSELERCLPEVTTLFEGGEIYYNTTAEEDFILGVYEECPSISIDYGVMEKTSKAWMFPSAFGWSDVGTWGSIYERSPHRSEQGNIIKCGVSLIDDVKGSIIETKNPSKLVVVKGMDNVMVIDMDDVLLVCPRDDKSIKDIVTDLAMKEKAEKYL